MKSIGIIRGLGGNGSTFLSRAIAAMDGIVLLSESNPCSANLFGFALNPSYQIARHYARTGLPEHDGNIVELGAPPLFGHYVERLIDACDASGRRLVLRDYNIADFAGTPFVWPCPRRSSLDAALPGLERRSALLVRHPVTQFLSLRAHPELVRALDYRVFLGAWRRLAETYETAHLLKYETLFDDFPATLAALADAIGFPFDAGFESKIDRVTWMTGNFAGLSSTKPTPSRRSALETQVRTNFLAEDDYRWACARFGYEP